MTVRGVTLDERHLVPEHIYARIGLEVAEQYLKPMLRSELCVEARALCPTHVSFVCNVSELTVTALICKDCWVNVPSGKPK